MKTSSNDIQNSFLEDVYFDERKEQLKKYSELLEHKEIFEIIKERKKESKDSYISLEDMAKKLDINLDNL
ncbi:hypothetical protein NG776_02635 [Aliarcobacter cryaerophilus]|uniref:hypothetical protein n=1 Tax=Aliarcobacter TaxID=2321111 RepID=UPI0029A18EEA|nr:hypothetical protein [Aliarcobacter skirrowii]MDX4036357.1 hypothetical protein [Aliarcobacter skirrowii]